MEVEKIVDIPLKRCPFCDGEAVLIVGRGYVPFTFVGKDKEVQEAFVKCTKCEACGAMPSREEMEEKDADEVPDRVIIQSAVDAWNTRVEKYDDWELAKIEEAVNVMAAKISRLKDELRKEKKNEASEN